MGYKVGIKPYEFWTIKDSSNNSYAKISYSFKHTLHSNSLERYIYGIVWRPDATMIAKSEKSCRETLMFMREHYISSLKDNDNKLKELLDKQAKSNAAWIESNIQECINRRDFIRHCLGPDILISNVLTKLEVTERCYTA